MSRVWLLLRVAEVERPSAPAATLLYVVLLAAGCDCGASDDVDAGAADAARDASTDASLAADAGPGDAGSMDASPEPDAGLPCDGTLASIMPAWQTAFCEGYLLCNGSSGSYVYETTAWHASFDDCVRVGSWQARNLWSWAREGPPFGPRRVDCALAEECVQATRSVCPDYPPQASRVAMGQGYPDPCNDMWLAPAGIRTGSRCELTTDCPETDYCADRVCTPRIAAGAACTYDDECAYDGSGDFAACIASTRSCGGGRQGALGEEGEACGEVSVSDGLANYVQCRPGLGCDFAVVPTDGTCRPPSPSGGPCTFGGLGQYCELGTRCSTSNRCEPFTYAGDGDPCMPYGGDTWCDPRESLVCSRGSCTPLGDGSVGAPCGVFFTDCGPGLRCDVPTGTCVTR